MVYPARIELRLTAAMLDDLKDLATRQDRQMAYVVRTILDEGIQRMRSDLDRDDTRAAVARCAALRGRQRPPEGFQVLRYAAT